MVVILAKGNYRFSGESDDYPPDITRHTKKASKEKKFHSSSRSVGTPLVTVAEPYPKGSLLGPLLNPLHKAIHETTVGIARAPGDLLYGTRPGEKVSKSSRSLRDSDEESDSEEYTDSEEESDDDDPIRGFERKAERDMATAHRRAEEDLRATRRGDGNDPISALQKKTERDVAAAHRKAEEDLKAWHRKAAADRKALRGLTEGRRAERKSRREDRRAEREARREERRSRKHGKVKESGGDVPTGRFRLVICYWDGQGEVY